MAQYLTGNFLDDPDADVFVFPANGVLKKDGSLTMGRGAAQAVLKKYPKIDQQIGDVVSVLSARSSAFFEFLYQDHLYVAEDGYGVFIGALQTKYHWYGDSSLELIEKSLMVMAKNDAIGDPSPLIISMAYPGIGLGGLAKEDVQPLIEKHLGFLGDRLRVYDLGSQK
jgi:hypothetical protein